MAAPWERYAAPAAAAGAGPWARYGAPQAAPEPELPMPPPEAPAAPERPSAIGSALRGVARSATFGLADEMKAGVQSALGNGPYGELLAKYRGQFRADEATNPVASVAGQLYGGVGSALAVPAAALGALPAAARAVAGGALAGGATGFGEGEGGAANRLAEAGTGALVGGAVGGAVGAAGAGIGRMVAPVRPNLSPEAQRLVQQAQAEGIPLSAGQETGSRTLKNLEGQLAQLPGSSAIEANAREAQQRAFNAAVLRRAGVEADTATPDVLNAARQRIGGEIGDIAGRNTLNLTEETANRLRAVEDGLQYLPAEAAAPVRARLGQLRGMVAEDGTLPGSAYRAMDSQLGRSMRGTTNGDLRASLGELRDTMRSAMDDSIGEADAGAWQQARRQYANLMTAAEATRGAGGAVAEGNISPLALRGALDKSTGGGYVWGRGDLNDLARIGQSVLRQPPDSGTAGRSVMNSLLTGSLPITGGAAGFAAGGPIGAAVGATAPFVVPPAVQAFINSPAGRRWLTNQLAPGFQPGVNAAAATAAGAVERNRLLPD